MNVVEHPAERPELSCEVDSPVLLQPAVRGVSFGMGQRAVLTYNRDAILRSGSNERGKPAGSRLGYAAILLALISRPGAAEPAKRKVMPRVAEVTLVGLPAFAEVSEWKDGGLAPLFLGTAKAGEAQLTLPYEAAIELRGGAIVKETPAPREVFLDVRAPGFAPLALTLSVPGPASLEVKLERVGVPATDATGCAVGAGQVDTSAAERPWLQTQAGQAPRALEAYRAARDASGAPWLDYELALAMLEAGRPAEAITHLEAFLQRCPASARRLEARRLLEALKATP